MLRQIAAQATAEADRLGVAVEPPVVVAPPVNRVVDWEAGAAETRAYFAATGRWEAITAYAASYRKLA